MSIWSNGASMLTQLLPTSRTKGHSLDNVTKNQKLSIRNSSSRRLACLQWDWQPASKTSRSNKTTQIDPSIYMRQQWYLLSWSSSTPTCSFGRCWTLFRIRISKFWPVEKINLIKDEHHDLLKVYNSNLILKMQSISKSIRHHSTLDGTFYQPADLIPCMHLLVVLPLCLPTQHQLSLIF